MENNKKKKMVKNFEKKETKINVPRLILRIVIVALALLLLLFIIKIAPNYTKDEFADRINLVINNNNITRNVKSEIIIDDNTIYLSTDDVKNFFDEFLLVEKENDRIITTSNTKTVVIPFNSNTIYVSGANIDIEHKLLIKDNIIYMPMTDLTDIYNIEIKYLKRWRNCWQISKTFSDNVFRS